MRAVKGYRKWAWGALLVAALLAPPSQAAQTVPSGRAQVVVSGGGVSGGLSRVGDVVFGGAAPRGVPVIVVDDRVRYQRISGFGAAMTDTSAWLLDEVLSPQARAKVMSELFGASGIHLSFLRVPMGASDFTKDRRPYSYDDLPPGRTDPPLAHFSVRHDLPYIIPALRQALALNPRLQILANPWSPPAWMKTNHSLNNQDNQGLLYGWAYRPWARYFVKFIEAYARLGIPIAAITPQNEPTNPTLYPGLDLPSTNETRFITYNLTPALHKAHLHPRLYGGDGGFDVSQTPYTSQIDGKQVLLESGRDYVDTLLTGRPGRATRSATGAAAGVLGGVAWHCYFGSPGVMSAVHGIAPRLDQIVDECSPGISPFPVSELVIAATRNWASEVALWNLALDPRGGPVQPPNHGCPTCSGVVTIDQHTHTARLTSSYFQLGQASAFVQPGAYRIKSGHFVSYRYTGPGTNVVTPGLDDVALLNPDGSRVLIAYNNSKARIRFAVKWHQHTFTYTLAPQTTATFTWHGPT